MQMNTEKNKKKKQLSMIFTKVVFTYFFLVWGILLSGQVVIKGDTQLYVKSDSVFSSDTIIHQRTNNTLKTEESVAKLYVVKRTITSNLTENPEIEVIYIEAPKSKSNQKKKETTLTKSKKTERSIAQPQKKPETQKSRFFVSSAPKGNTDLVTGKEIIVASVTFTPSVKKEVSNFKNELINITTDLKNKPFNQYFNVKIFSSLDPKSIKIRPPPIYI